MGSIRSVAEFSYSCTRFVCSHPPTGWMDSLISYFHSPFITSRNPTLHTPEFSPLPSGYYEKRIEAQTSRLASPTFVPIMLYLCLPVLAPLIFMQVSAVLFCPACLPAARLVFVRHYPVGYHHQQRTSTLRPRQTTSNVSTQKIIDQSVPLG